MAAVTSPQMVYSFIVSGGDCRRYFAVSRYGRSNTGSLIDLSFNAARRAVERARDVPPNGSGAKFCHITICESLACLYCPVSSAVFSGALQNDWNGKF